MSDLRDFFSLHPHIAAELYLWASEIVDDFEDYGPVLQSADDGRYDESTAFGRLRIVRNSIIQARRPLARTGALVPFRPCTLGVLHRRLVIFPPDASARHGSDSSTRHLESQSLPSPGSLGRTITVFSRSQ